MRGSKRRVFRYRAGTVVGLTAAILLAACGCQTPDDETVRYSVGGTVTGLESGRLVLRNEGVRVTVEADGPFVFPQTWPDDAVYRVVVDTAPDAHGCAVAGGVGRIEGGDVTSVRVMCEADRPPGADFVVTLDFAQSRLSVVEGESVRLTVRVQNFGERPGEQDIVLQVAGTPVDTVRAVALAPGEAETLTLVWTTELGDAGSYPASVVSEDGGVSTTVYVYTRPHFTIAVDSTASTLTAAEGSPIEIVATVTNTGGVTSTQDIRLVVDGLLRDWAPDVTLAPDASRVLSFIWTPAAGEAGTYDAVVRSPDDAATVPVTILAPARFTVTLDREASTLGGNVGEPLTLVAVLENVGEVDGLADVTFTVAGTLQYTASAVAVAAGGEETVTFQHTGDTAGFFEAALATGDDEVRFFLAVRSPGTPLPAFFDVRIESESSILAGVAGDTLHVVATVENLGDADGTTAVALGIGTVHAETRPDVFVGAGATETVSFSWATTPADGGTHEASVDTGDARDAVWVKVVADATLEGRVTDAHTAVALTGVEVRTYAAASGTFVGASFADETGRYAISGLAPGSYHVRLSAPGLSPHHALAEAGGAQSLDVSLGLGTHTQYLTVDRHERLDLLLDGGRITFLAADFPVILPRCELDETGRWRPVAEEAPPNTEVRYVPDDACYRIDDIRIDLATGALFAEVDSALFPSVVVLIHDLGDSVDSAIDRLEVELTWSFDEIGGRVDFRTGEVWIDIDMRILVGGTVHATLAFDFGARAGYEDCQLTQAWGGDVDAPTFESDRPVHTPLASRLTTGGIDGTSYDPVDDTFRTSDDTMSVGRLSEGRFGRSDPGGASCGEMDGFGATWDYARSVNDLLVLPAAPGEIESRIGHIVLWKR